MTPGGRRSPRPTVDADGTRALVEVLLLHRHLAHEHVVAGMTSALSVGALSADVVALEARKAAENETPAGPIHDKAKVAAPEPVVASLTRRRLAQLPPDTRALPSVVGYDQLLKHPRATQ